MVQCINYVKLLLFVKYEYFKNDAFILSFECYGSIYTYNRITMTTRMNFVRVIRIILQS